jgi:putative phosphotransacetylase
MDDVERLASEVIRRLSGSGERPAGSAGEVSPDGEAGSSGTSGGIPVAVSGRHVHVSRGVLDRLFGDGFQLTKLRDLGQPGEFASEQTVTAVGPSMRPLERVRVLGPVRNYTQLEISGTDAVRLGIDPPVRRSGDLVGSEPITLVGPKGSVQINEGAIMATRHLHMTERDAREHGVSDGDRVRIRFPGERALVLENVLVRVGKTAALELHLDTDDANAAGVRLPMTVKILR